MDIHELEKLMTEHGLVIRAIPHESVATYDARHKDSCPEGVVYYDERLKREMLRVVRKNSRGGKIIITQKGNQDTIVNSWGRPVMFYNSIEEAVRDFITQIQPRN